jgi:hypothetical protein
VPAPVLALPEATSSRTSPAKAAFIQFPARSIGRLDIVDNSWNPLGTFPNGQLYSQAQGRVSIRPGLILKFVPNMALCQCTGILSEFPPDALQMLDLARMEPTDELLYKVGQLHSIRALSLEETDVDDEHMKKLGGLVNLQFFDISRCMVKGPGLRYLTASRDLRQLRCNFSIVGPDLGENLQQFPKLAYLSLVHSQVKDKVLISVAKLKSLEHLKLSSNDDITNSGIETLAALPRLSNLEIDDTHVTPSGLVALKGLPLRSVWIDDRYNTKNNLALLHKTFPLANIHFRGVRPRTDIPTEFFRPLH